MRRISVWTTLLAAVIMTVVFFSPPSSSNTAHPTDLVLGGVNSQQELLEKYNRNDYDIKSIFTSLGITHGDLLSSRTAEVTLTPSHYLSQRTTTENQADTHTYSYKKSNGEHGSISLSSLAHIKPSTQSRTPALVGTSATLGSFAIILSSGNIALTEKPDMSTALCSASDDDNPSTECPPPVSLSSRAHNATQNTDATTTTSQPRDRIIYTLTATNPSDTPQDTAIVYAASDILEYAEIVDTDGGIIDNDTQTITWPISRLAPQESATRTLSIRLHPDIAATAQGQSNPASFDCRITSTTGDLIAIDVACPPLKQLELLTRSLPSVPLIVSFVGSLILAATALTLYVRTKLYGEEVRLIRKDINTGTLL